MLSLQPHSSSEPFSVSDSDMLPTHSSFLFVHAKVKQWFKRFSFHDEHSLFNELLLFYLLAPKQYLDHRTPLHCFRSVLSIYLLQKQLQHSVTFAPHVRHLKVRWKPTQLFFPFSSKSVLGCFLGFNVMGRYELFDEENVVLALEKNFPHCRMVKESFYCHTSQNRELKAFYFEIEKKDGEPFSLTERIAIKNSLEEKIKNSIQLLSPVIFTNSNEEEVYKNILALSREIDSIDDPPHAYISLDHHSGKEIAFRVVLVYSAPYHRFSLKKLFYDCTFISERVLTLRHVDNRPIEAHIFRLLFPRDPSYLRSDGSLDFYSAREKAVTSIRSAIGEFRDYNGGILLKQQELFRDFKSNFPEEDPELLNDFFYTLIPLEKRVVLRLSALCNLFTYFLKNRPKQLKECSYSLETFNENSDLFIIAKANQLSFTEIIPSFLQEPIFASHQFVYNFIETPEGSFFNCIFMQMEETKAEPLLQIFQRELYRWQQNKKNLQVLRIGAEYLPYSLDPRVGGELVSGNILRLLFEGLTRYDQHGNLENGLAQSIDVSSDAKQYIFKLRPSFWNDGSAVTASDFEYAWKKILSPHFKTAFARVFYPIKHAKEAKKGEIPIDDIGIKVIDERTLKIELEYPVPYFLQLTALPLFSPVHRIIDQQCPQWPYQREPHYPCNGPFQLQIHQPAQRYQLTKNPLYWNAKQIVLDQIIIKQMNSYQLLHAFRKNELDWIGNPLGSWNSCYIPANEDRLLTLSNHWTCWNIFNTQSPLMKHRKLREAILLSIDRSEMSANAPLSLIPAYTLLFPRSNHPHHLFPERNIQKARRLFKEALEELGIEKELFPPLTLVFHPKGIREHIANHLQRQLQESLDIACLLVPLPWNQLFDKMVQGQFHMGLWNWISPVDDPISTLNAFRFANDEGNFSKWEHSEFQQFLDQSDQELNPFQRSTYLLQAEKVLAREVPVFPLFFQPSHCLVKQGWQVPFRDAPGLFNFSRIIRHKE